MELIDDGYGFEVEFDRVSDDVYTERYRQEEKFPGQVLPYVDSFDVDYWAEEAEIAKRSNDRAMEQGVLCWNTVLYEELAESFAETDPVKMRAELIQTAAVVFRVVAQIDRELDV